MNHDVAPAVLSVPRSPGLPVLVLSHMFPHADDPRNGCFVHEQVQALRNRGDLDVRVISARPYPMFLREPTRLLARWRGFRAALAALSWTEWDGVPVLYVPYLVGRFAQLLCLHAPYRDSVVRAAHWLRSQFRFALVHAHTAWPDGYAGLALARLFQVPLVITEHTGPFSTITTKRWMRAQTLAALGSAQRVWCVSESLAREVKSYLSPQREQHIRTLPNGVDTTLFQPPTSWPRDRKTPRLLFVGYLLDVKNPLLLIEAFALLRARVPAATLQLVGDGCLRDSVQRRIAALNLSGSVTLLGQRSRAEVARLMREECDILVLPSRSETFGVVLIEALACGKPVVATRCGGPESIITRPYLGALCNPEDVKALSHGLLEVVSRLPTFDPERIRRHALDHFDFRHLAGTLAEEYREIVAERVPLPRSA